MSPEATMDETPSYAIPGAVPQYPLEIGDLMKSLRQMMRQLQHDWYSMSDEERAQLLSTLFESTVQLRDIVLAHGKNRPGYEKLKETLRDMLETCNTDIAKVRAVLRWATTTLEKWKFLTAGPALEPDYAGNLWDSMEQFVIPREPRRRMVMPRPLAEHPEGKSDEPKSEEQKLKDMEAL